MPRGDWKKLFSLGGALVVVGVFCGVASALFLWSLDGATRFREAHGWLPWLLPLWGVALGWVLENLAGPARRGTGQVIERVQGGGHPVSVRLPALALVGTVLTHLFGGSAGREGTAVQMGGGIGEVCAGRLGLQAPEGRRLVVAGVAAGFGSVFGTPWAGVVFALEFGTFGKLDWRALGPALVASWLGHATTLSLGIVHTPYPAVAPPALSWGLVLALALLALAVAGAAAGFIELTKLVRSVGEHLKLTPSTRLGIGACLVILLWQLSGTSRYLGLGVPHIVDSFAHNPGPVAFAWKLVMTAVTVGSGFWGGEVTPLFFVGSHLGAFLGPTLGIGVPFGAALGLCGVFGAAANTPLALAVLGCELFGWRLGPYLVSVTALSCWFSGQRGIYDAQRASLRKWPPGLSREVLMNDRAPARR